MKPQCDGINFIEHLSFNAFNEGTRLIQSIRYGRSLFGQITHISADDIYAANRNREYSTNAKIATDFKRKGSAGEVRGSETGNQQGVKKGENDTNGGQLWSRKRRIMTFRKSEPKQTRLKYSGSSLV